MSNCYINASRTPYSKPRPDLLQPSAPYQSRIPPATTPTPTPCSTNLKVIESDLKESALMIKEYLDKTGFPYNLGIEELTRLNGSNAKEIANFLIRRIDSSAILDNFEEEFPAFLRIVSIHTMLSSFAWLIHLLDFLELSQHVVDPPPSEYLILIYEQFSPSDVLTSQRRSILPYPVVEADDKMAQAIVDFVDRHSLEQVDWIESGMGAANSNFLVTEADLDEVLMLFHRCRRRYFHKGHLSCLAEPTLVEEDLLLKFVAFYRHLLALIKIQSDLQHRMLVEERERLVHKISKIRSQTNDLEMVKAALTAIRNDSSTLEASLSASEQTVAEGTTNVDTLEKKLSELNITAHELDRRCDEYRTKAVDLENRSNELQRYQTGISDLEEEMRALEKSLKSMKEKSDTLLVEMKWLCDANSAKWKEILNWVLALANGCIADGNEVLQKSIKEITRVLVEVEPVKPQRGAAEKCYKKFTPAELFRLEGMHTLDSVRNRITKENNGDSSSQSKIELQLEKIRMLLNELRGLYQKQLMPEVALNVEELETAKISLIKDCSTQVHETKQQIKSLELRKAQLERTVHELENENETRIQNITKKEIMLEAELLTKQKEFEEKQQNALMRTNKSKINQQTRDNELHEKAHVLRSRQNSLFQEMSQWEYELKPQLWKSYKKKVIDFFLGLPEPLKRPLVENQQWLIAAGLMVPASEQEEEQYGDMADGDDEYDSGKDEDNVAQNSQDSDRNSHRCREEAEGQENVIHWNNSHCQFTGASRGRNSLKKQVPLLSTSVLSSSSSGQDKCNKGPESPVDNLKRIVDKTATLQNMSPFPRRGARS